MSFLLDTNILIAAIKGEPSVRAQLECVKRSDIILSPIVLGELQLRVAKSATPERNAMHLQRVIDQFELKPLLADTCLHYADIRANLERQGQTIGANDYWIAAHARSLNVTLVTDNMREFSRVPGLTVENWLR